MRKVICSAVFVISVSTVSIAWAQGPGIVDPVRPAAANIFLCTLNAGKSMTDVNAAEQMWLSKMEEGEHNGITFRLTPRYGNSPFDVVWIDYLPIDQFAQSSEWWDDNGQELLAAFNEVTSCQTSLDTNYLDYLNEPISEEGQAFFFWNWCTPRDGVTQAAVAASRRDYVQGLSDDGVRGASMRMYSFVGNRTRLGQFAEVFVSPDWAAITRYHEYVATGGWRDNVAFNENVAQCIGTNVYDLTVLNLPHTPWSN